MLDRIRELRYGKRPPALSVQQVADALPEMDKGPIPDGDPVGAQGDNASHDATAKHIALKAMDKP